MSGLRGLQFLSEHFNLTELCDLGMIPGNVKIGGKDYLLLQLCHMLPSFTFKSFYSLKSLPVTLNSCPLNDDCKTSSLQISVITILLSKTEKYLLICFRSVWYNHKNSHF